MIQLFTPGAWLVKGDEKKLKGERFYTKEELEGWTSPSHRILIIDRDTMQETSFFPGQPITFGEPDLEAMTKKELKALMPEKIFPKKTTKEELIEAYHGRD